MASFTSRRRSQGGLRCLDALKNASGACGAGVVLAADLRPRMASLRHGARPYDLQKTKPLEPTRGEPEAQRHADWQQLHPGAAFES